MHPCFYGPDCGSYQWSRPPSARLRAYKMLLIGCKHKRILAPLSTWLVPGWQRVYLFSAQLTCSSRITPARLVGYAWFGRSSRVRLVGWFCTAGARPVTLCWQSNRPKLHLAGPAGGGCRHPISSYLHAEPQVQIWSLKNDAQNCLPWIAITSKVDLFLYLFSGIKFWLEVLGVYRIWMHLHLEVIKSLKIYPR